MILNENFVEFIEVFNKLEIKYVLVGGWAVVFEGYERVTGDMDLLVERTPENADKVLAALKEFWGSDLGFVREDFLKDDNVLMMGRPPLRIDLLTSISGVSFDEVYATSVLYQDGSTPIRCIHINELIRNKEASGRLKDLADAEKLKKIREKRNRRK